MAKRIDKFFDRIVKNYNLVDKFSKNPTPGSRIVPPRNPKDDISYGLRIDAGELINGKRKVVLQVNSVIDTPGLKDWKNKHSTHAKLATASFDTDAEDKAREVEQLVEKLRADAKENAKNNSAAD